MPDHVLENLEPWLDYVRGRLPPEMCPAVEAELRRAASRDDAFVALLLRLRQIADRAGPEAATRGAVANVQDRIAPDRLVVMRPFALPELSLLQAPEPGHVFRSYDGGGWELDVLFTPSGMTGELRDSSGHSLEGVTLGLAEEAGHMLASATLDGRGEFALDARVPRRFYLAVEGEWLRVER